MEIPRRPLLLIGISITTITFTFLIGLSIHQALALSVFATTLTALIFFWNLKVPITLLGVSILIVLGLTDIPHLIEAMNLDVLLFLIGMMIVIRFLEEKRFFEYIMSMALSRVRDNGLLLIILLMLLSALFASLVGAVVAALLMTTSIIYLAGRLRISTMPLILMISFAINIGSSATLMGNPVGVLIAMKSGLSFSDFIRWATPISLASLLLTILVSIKMFRKEIAVLDKHLKIRYAQGELEDLRARIPQNELLKCWTLFLATILGLALSRQLENVLGLEKNTMLIGVTLLSASIALLLERERAREIIERGIDWWTLLFFMLLFASVGSLEYVGITDILTESIAQISGNETLQLIIITILTGILSAFLDNVLAVATVVPIIIRLREQGYSVYPLWWGTLFGGTFFGNLTLIASTANIIAVSVLERRGLGRIDFIEWLKKGTIITALTITLAIIMLTVQLTLR